MGTNQTENENDEEIQEQETIGELYDRLPTNEWVEVYGFRLKKVEITK